MTKSNMFGETIHTADDEPDDFALYLDEEGGAAWKAVISDDQSELGWCAEVYVDNGEEGMPVQVHGFANAGALQDWLEKAGVSPGVIEVEG